MFIRVKTTPNSPRKSIQIVENVRDGARVKQKIVHHVGIALDEAEAQKLRHYGQELIKKITLQREAELQQGSFFPIAEADLLTTPPSQEEVVRERGRPRLKTIEEVLPPSQVTLEDIVEESRLIEGIHEIGGAMFDELYGGLVKQSRVYQRMRDVVLMRLAEPVSKYGTAARLNEQYDTEHDLDALYRMMDQLHPLIDKVKQRTFAQTCALFPDGVDLLLFDVTTLYFESVESDELRAYGYSKDCRFNTTQVVLALATNGDGLPLGYELFAGNQAEVGTLARSIEHWKTLFKIDQVCFVGDRAMFSERNLSLMEQAGYQYVVASKLKALPQPLIRQILDESAYQPMATQPQNRVAEFNHQGRRLIVSYKAERAAKDKKDRERLVTKTKKRLGTSRQAARLITNQGVKSVTRIESATVTLDDAKLQAAEQWDGLHGLITNIKDQDATTLLARYARLWVIEASFRINKHNLKMRPIFHWKKERIESHVALCYMAFATLRHLEYRVSLTQKLSVNTIVETLREVQSSIYIHKTTKDRYRVPGKFSHTARKIYTAFGLERSQDAEVYRGAQQHKMTKRGKAKQD